MKKKFISILLSLCLFPVDSFAATVTKSIGTSSRDYSTVTAWEADLTSNTIYNDNDVALGEMYADSDFDESVTINGGNLDFGGGNVDITLSVVEADRHDGTSSASNARFLMTGAAQTLVVEAGFTSAKTVTLQWIDMDFNGQTATNLVNLKEMTGSHLVKNSLFHHGTRPLAINGIRAEEDAVIINNMIYNVECTDTSTGDAIGIETTPQAAAETLSLQNNTVHDVTNDGGSGNAYGISTDDHSSNTIENNVMTQADGSSSGTLQCYADSNYTVATTNTNAASDTSASGTGAIDSITTANQYVSTTVGSEDLHIQDTDADIYEAGTDLGTTNGVNIDIDGFDRTTSGASWSIGAHDNHTAAQTNPPRQRRVIKILTF